MEYVILGLIGLGMLISLVGSVLFLVAAFRVNVWWGLGVLFFGPVGLIFVILHWDESKQPLGYQILGLLVMVGAVAVGYFQAPGLTEKYVQRVQTHIPAGTNMIAEFEKAVKPSNVSADLPPTPRPADPTPSAQPLGPKSLVGRTLDEARERYGRPRGEMMRDNQVCYMYDAFSAFSDDGKTISHVEMHAE